MCCVQQTLPHPCCQAGQITPAIVCFQVVKAKPELLVPANPPILDGVNDLTSLSYLNEPSILHDLRQRYDQDQVRDTQRSLVLLLLRQSVLRPTSQPSHQLTF
jgi:hypothetical protein